MVCHNYGNEPNTRLRRCGSLKCGVASWSIEPNSPLYYGIKGVMWRRKERGGATPHARGNFHTNFKNKRKWERLIGDKCIGTSVLNAKHLCKLVLILWWMMWIKLEVTTISIIKLTVIGINLGWLHAIYSMILIYSLHKWIKRHLLEGDHFRKT